MKAKFRDDVRSKTDVAMKNEVLCKVIAHNICCLIMSQVELGIDATFWGDRSAQATPETQEATATEVTQADAAPVEWPRWACAGA